MPARRYTRRETAEIEHILKASDYAGADQLGLVLKIETAQGCRALPLMLLVAMRRARLGVMIARGDLVAEVGYERLSEVPRQILALCEAAHVPAIWATQVLEVLAKTGQPSRAEITDAAATSTICSRRCGSGPAADDPQLVRLVDALLGGGA